MIRFNESVETPVPDEHQDGWEPAMPTRMTLDQAARLILGPPCGFATDLAGRELQWPTYESGWHVVHKTEERMVHVAMCAARTKANPLSRRGRTDEQIDANTDGLAVEFMLAQVPGFSLGGAHWVDVVHGATGATFECKKFNERWFSFRQSVWHHTKENLDLVDYVVMAKVVDSPDSWMVMPWLVAPVTAMFNPHSRRITRYVEPSRHNNTKVVFNHMNAMRAGHAAGCPQSLETPL